VLFALFQLAACIAPATAAILNIRFQLRLFVFSIVYQLNAAVFGGQPLRLGGEPIGHAAGECVSRRRARVRKVKTHRVRHFNKGFFV
jgi:hypothetical protein